MFVSRGTVTVVAGANTPRYASLHRTITFEFAANMTSLSTTNSIKDLSCKYSYKKCPNQRTTKRNGTLHTLCEYHRVKANTLQQVYAKKKKEGTITSSSTTKPHPGHLKAVQRHDEMCPPWLESIDFSKSEFITQEDCAMLHELFFHPHAAQMPGCDCCTMCPQSGITDLLHVEDIHSLET
ncbi:hypothetical protein DYB28_007481 [Aphanomyces astaci]|uniref:Uncharacterized protein n=1 Tax=Aphanomyces astaci TaxID=112090 RepID=A0A9X8DUJ3_APHAT|nr:hypothetical protein DYB28_007481 [Aphanomyces astaci]